MENVNKRLFVFLVPSGKGTFRKESYSRKLRNNEIPPEYWERKVASNKKHRRILPVPEPDILNDIDAIFQDFPDDDV